MKELDSFTVERLEKWINTPEKYDHRYSPRINCDELRALARIALAAKRAKESHSRREVWDGGNTWVQCSKQAYDRHEAAGQRVRMLYERPQLNSPEMPEGWNGTLETAAKLIDLCRTYTILGDSGSYKERTINDCELTMQEIESYLAAAPEKENG
ncbi:hypothetical protein QK140_003046 [Yersinia enterocolitica]|nr:hypothetical protein [Yersinia enterocolitica]